MPDGERPMNRPADRPTVRKRSPLRRLFTEIWSIGICYAPITRFADPNFVAEVEWLPRPKGRYAFFADPFAFGDDILCEYLDRSSANRGSIVRLKRRGDAFEIEPILRRRWHLSYPYTFVVDGRCWCLPESWSNGVLSLVDAETWREAATLVAAPLVDPTVVQWAGLWWLFATIADAANIDRADSHLYVWHAENPLGPWRQHPRNPVKADSASARPGGTPFVHEGRLFRPAQDCSRSYGGAINLMEVTRLDPAGFEERLHRRIDPIAPYVDGIHTLSRFGDKTLVDGKRVIFAPDRIARRSFQIVRRTATCWARRAVPLGGFHGGRK
jgi:hypothetical protein